jgi:hemerythrin-like domain-containing protein
MDAFELLKEDHKKVAGLFDQLESATGKAKLGVFRQIKTELELHTHVEEKIFYPALEKPEETHDLTLEAYEEHAVVKTLLAELSRATSADDEWQAKAKVLRENVEHHVKEEENELFNKADDVLSDGQIQELGQQMEAEKARKQGRPDARTNRKAPGKKKGIVSRLAEFVGLGSKSTAKKSRPAKKGAAKKESATKATSKKSAGKNARSVSKTSKTLGASKAASRGKASKKRSKK